MPGLRRAMFSLLLALCCGTLPLLAAAQSAVPSAEQMDLLRSLTPEQREALLEQMSSGASSSGSQASETNTRNGKDSRNARNGKAAKRDTEGLAGRKSTRASGDGADTEEDYEDVVLKPDDSVLIDISLPSPPGPEYIVPPGSPAGTPPILVPPPEPDPENNLTAEERKKLLAVVALIRSRNPYTLDRTGALQLPGFPAIALAGLDEEQATSRLMAEPAFQRMKISLTRLPLARVGVAGLKPFGYDLFEDEDSSFSPVTELPVPAEYIVGSGDQLSVQLYGSQNRTLRLTVGRDGSVSFPEIGPINVGGRRFEAVRSDIESRVRRQIIGVRAAVSMADTRSIRVFVMGEAKRPGSYTISGLGTVTTALYASGGVKPIGSLRDIQVKRQGAVVRRVDLYDLLLRGDTTNDVKLLSGDVILIPPVGPTVAIDGEVRRPAIYELRGDAQVADVVELAGGLTAEADAARANLSRVDEQRRRVVLDVDLDAVEGRSRLLRNGDTLRISRIRPQIDSGVVVRGHVYSPGAFAWRENLRLSDVIPSVDDLKPNADLGYLLIRRELPPDRRIVALSADLSRALRDRGGPSDLRLNPRDQITVFDLESGRDQEINRLLEEIRLQARQDRPTAIVRVGGRVKVPGEYPLEPNMRVSGLIRAGGNLSDAAYGGTAELTRYTVVDGEARRTELVEIDLSRVLLGESEADLALQPFDYLNIKQIPEWNAQDEVVLKGEVRFPGTYPIKRGETMRSVLTRAGGLTDYAFAEGAVFTREDLRDREQQQIDALTVRLQTDIATMSLAAAAANQQGAVQASTVGQTLLTQLKATRAVGRLVIDLDRVIAADTGQAGDIVLQGGDVLAVPRRSQEVTVLGEVQNATSHLFRPGLTRDDYVSLSGGPTRRADENRIYVVRANGSVVSSQNTRWFSRGSVVAIKPGDTIVAPLDTERLPTLPLWQAVTQIVYNLAIAAAAINSF